MRQVFDEEIALHPAETRVLQDVLIVLIDQPDRFSSEEQERVLSDANIIAPSLVADKSSRARASLVWDGALAGMVVSAGVFASLPCLSSTASIIAGTVASIAKRSQKKSTDERSVK